MDTTTVERLPIGPLVLMGVAGLCGLIIFVLWIISIVKEFKAGDTVWGILTIILMIPGLIWLFINGEKKLGITWLLLAIVFGVCVGACFATLMTLGETNAVPA